MKKIIFGVQSNGYPVHIDGEISLDELYLLRDLISVMIENRKDKCI